MKIEELCGDCATGSPSREELVPIGGPSRTEGQAGKRGHWLEMTQEYKCPNCGTRWENLKESGASRGNFWTRIDPPK
jgi:rubredoxin